MSDNLEKCSIHGNTYDKSKVGRCFRCKLERMPSPAKKENLQFVDRAKVKRILEHG